MSAFSFFVASLHSVLVEIRLTGPLALAVRAINFGSWFAGQTRKGNKCTAFC